VAGDQHYLAFPDRHIARPAVLDDSENDVAAQLIEELLVRVIVVVGPRVRAADDLDDQVLGFREHQLVAHRRLQQVRVLVDPARKVERGERHGTEHSIMSTP